MLVKRPRHARQGERGQVLILALAFIAVFGVITVAILRFGDVVGIQHVHTEATAASDTLAEGGAEYAAADSARSDFTQCAPGNGGQLTMQTRDVVTYTINPNGCGPGNTQYLLSHCLLCILNETPTTVAGTFVLTATKGVTTTGGDDYINGSISNGTQLTATASSGTPTIHVLTGATTSGCTCSPLPVKTYPLPPISDPFNTLGAPSPVAGMPSGCTAQGSGTWDPVKGCTETLSTSGTYTIHPGLWASLSVSGQANVTVSSGVYVFTGGLTDSGQGTFTAASVTIYLACANYGPTGKACATSATKTGGFINFSGQGIPSIAGPGSAQYASVNGIADVAILTDPNLLDPGGVSNCRSGTSGACVYEVSGKGASVTGSIDTRAGGIAIAGNGGQTEKNGLLVTNSLSITVSGKVTTGLDLTGPGTLSTASCGVFDDTVTGKASGSSTTWQGRAIIESTCSGGLTNGVVAFNYGP
jgi:hypothetical protein